MSLSVCSLASGSKGNCIIVFTPTTKIILDVGISVKKVEHAFLNLGFSLPPPLKQKKTVPRPPSTPPPLLNLCSPLPLTPNNSINPNNSPNPDNSAGLNDSVNLNDSASLATLSAPISQIPAASHLNVNYYTLYNTINSEMPNSNSPRTRTPADAVTATSAPVSTGPAGADVLDASTFSANALGAGAARAPVGAGAGGAGASAGADVLDASTFSSNILGAGAARAPVGAGAGGAGASANAGVLGAGAASGPANAAAAGEEVALLVTHQHSDHARFVPALAFKYDLPVYAHARTLPHLRSSLIRRSVAFGQDDFFIGDITVSPFLVSHDVNCACFSFYHQGKKLTVMTDLGHVCDRLLEHIDGSDAIFIEANHDSELLKANKSYSSALKRRISSDSGHLSNSQCAATLEKLVRGRTKNAILGHLSEQNNYPELAFSTVCNHLSQFGFMEGTDIHISVAPAFGMSKIITLD